MCLWLVNFSCGINEDVSQSRTLIPKYLRAVQNGKETECNFQTKCVHPQVLQSVLEPIFLYYLTQLLFAFEIYIKYISSCRSIKCRKTQVQVPQNSSSVHYHTVNFFLVSVIVIVNYLQLLSRKSLVWDSSRNSATGRCRWSDRHVPPPVAWSWSHQLGSPGRLLACLWIGGGVKEI